MTQARGQQTVTYAAAAVVPPPPGYRAMPLGDPFEAHVGPLFEKTDADGALWYAFVLDERHANLRGVAHGGMLMTFADAVLGSAAWTATARQPCVTLSQESNFLRAVRVGDVVECAPRLVHKGSAIVCVEATLLVRGEAVMTARSLWKILGAP